MAEYLHNDYRKALHYFYSFAGYISRRCARPKVLRTLLDACGGSSTRHFPKIVQITGTNGKGSVCIGIEQILRHLGVATLCLNSPHINSVRDRIRVCGRPISREQFCDLLERLSPILERVRGTRLHPMPMQIITLMALVLHADLGEGYSGIYEVGMGGRYDSTNVFSRSTVGLCTISDDHLDEFEGSLIALAEEKVALCAPGSTLYFQPQTEEVLAVVQEYCNRCRVRQVCVPADDSLAALFGNKSLPAWALKNITLSCRLAAHLFPEAKNGELPPTLGKELLPRRLEERYIDGQIFILDGAHNRQAIEVLLGHLESLNGLERGSMAAIVGLSASKDWHPLLRRVLTSPLFEEVVFTQATRPRGVEPVNLVEEASAFRMCRAFPSLKSTLSWAFNSHYRQFAVFGSLLLAADFDKALHALGLGHFAVVDAEEIDPQQPWMRPLI